MLEFVCAYCGKESGVKILGKPICNLCLNKLVNLMNKDDNFIKQINKEDNECQKEN